MSLQDEAPVTDGTTSGGYGDAYSTTARLDAEGDHSWESDHWRGFHRAVAERIVAIANPKTTLDVGCAGGLLVQALAERGVDSHGLDTSEHAIADADPEVRPRLEVQSGTKPISGRYDLITCIDVVEHMDPRSAQATIDAMCAASDRILFSSSPADHAQPTRVNVHPTSDWTATFAERGFFRRTDVNLDFLNPWAVLFERSDLQPRDIVHRYEAHLVPLATELREKRQALLEMHREVTQLHDKLAGSAKAVADRPETVRHIANLEASLRSAQHDLLTSRDHIIGLEAESAQLRSLNARLELRRARQRKRADDLFGRLTIQRKRAARAERKLADVKASRAWRIGTALTRSSKTPKL